MLEFMPCKPGHMRYLTPLPVQTEEHKAMLTQIGVDLIERSTGLTAWAGTQIVGMAGVAQIWPGRAEAWIMLDRSAGRFVRPIVRKARYVLDNYPSRRIEIVVKTSNVEGHKIAALLRFGEPEGVLRAYHPEGDDMVMYARISDKWQQ